MEQLKKEFDSLDEKQQWEYAIKCKEEITLYLDNDNTSFTFDKEDKEDDCTMFYFKADIGNRWGIGYLFSIIGLKCEEV